MSNGTLNLLESIAEVPDRQVAKTGKSSIMAYGGMSYVGMAPKKMAATFKSAQMTRSKCLR